MKSDSSVILPLVAVFIGLVTTLAAFVLNARYRRALKKGSRRGRASLDPQEQPLRRSTRESKSVQRWSPPATSSPTAANRSASPANSTAEKGRKISARESDLTSRKQRTPLKTMRLNATPVREVAPKREKTKTPSADSARRSSRMSLRTPAKRAAVSDL